MLTRFVIFSFCCALLLTPCFAADLQENRRQLEEIRQRIEDAQSDLANKEKSEVKLSRELTLLRRTLQRIDDNITTLKKEQRQLRRQIDDQQDTIATGKRELRTIGKRLEKRLVALYKEGEIGPLRILFSADSPTELVQQYQYLTRILEHDRQLLGEYRGALAKQQEKLSQLERLEQRQHEVIAQQQQEYRTAEDGRKLQGQLLKTVRADKQSLHQELAQLQEQAGRLKRLIEQLKKQPAPEQGASATEFTAGKGALGWPVQGEVLIGFGTQKDSSLGTIYESNGIEIAAKNGQPVHAVADGRVVFADWFKGYGNLVILSHPGGYHSLYAQIDKIQSSVGATIKAGDILGYSGLAGRDSIYFEIRASGAAVDPLQWLKKR